MEKDARYCEETMEEFNRDLRQKDQFALLTSNHGKLAGIEDYLDIVKAIFDSRGSELQITTELRPGATTIIIDEFTNYIENRRLTQFRQANPKTNIAYLLTEFCERRHGVESFNHFGSLFDSAVIAVADVAMRLGRDDFPRPRAWDLLRLAVYAPLFAGYAGACFTKYVFLSTLGRNLRNPIGEFLKRHHRLIYNHMRYLGLAAHLPHADWIVLSHEQILPGLRKSHTFAPLVKSRCLGVLYPEFDVPFVLNAIGENKRPGIEITGSLTRYRRKWISNLRRTLLFLGLQNSFEFKEISFEDQVSGQAPVRMTFSLHPPQSKAWAYSSPTRIFRALQKDHSVPVSTKTFGHNPIEELCIKYEGRGSLLRMVQFASDRRKLLSEMAPKLVEYTRIAKARNDEFWLALQARMKGKVEEIEPETRAKSSEQALPVVAVN